MAEMQTTTIRASITAYSTAVGPSSDRRKRRSCWRSLVTTDLLSKRVVNPLPREKPHLCSPAATENGQAGRARSRGVGRAGPRAAAVDAGWPYLAEVGSGWHRGQVSACLPAGYRIVRPA